MKTRVPGCPQELGRAVRPLAGTCNVDDWMREHLMGRLEGLVMPVLDAQLDMVDNASGTETKDS